MGRFGKVSQFQCYSKEDEPLLILTDDHYEISENVSSATTPQCSLSTALQNDNVCFSKTPLSSPYFVENYKQERMKFLS